MGQVSVTGNTVIDALLLMAENAPEISFDGLDWQNQRVILATVHRRENWDRLQEIASGMLQVLDRHPDTVPFPCIATPPCANRCRRCWATIHGWCSPNRWTTTVWWRR